MWTAFEFSMMTDDAVCSGSLLNSHFEFGETVRVIVEALRALKGRKIGAYRNGSEILGLVLIETDTTFVNGFGFHGLLLFCVWLKIHRPCHGIISNVQGNPLQPQPQSNVCFN
jgi:hypothetical protein